MRSRLLGSLAAVCIAAAVLQGLHLLPRLAAGAAAPERIPRVVLRRGTGPEPESLDPHGARSESALTILRDVGEGLTAVGADGAAVPAAADRVEISADGLTYTFHLRSGALWSNGEPVVAEDFAAAWRRLVDPKTAAQYADILNPVSGAAAIIRGSAAPSSLGARAADAATLVVQLTHPTPFFLGVLSHPATFPINRGSLAAHGRGFAKPGAMVCNGAFTLARWDFGSHIVATRNRRYWNDRATRLDAVEYYSFADSSSELNAYRTGELDVTATIPAARIDWIKAHLGAALKIEPQLTVYYLGMNLRKPPFDKSPELRQALSLVIDRARLVQAVTGAGEAPAYSFVPPATLGYTPPLPAYAGWPMGVRIARARELLRRAGMEEHPPAVELRYNQGELHDRIAVAVAQMWRDALHIEVSLRAEEWKALLEDIGRGEVSLFNASWIADYDDAFSFLQVLQGGFGINMPHYANAAYDALLASAAGETDRDRRRARLQEAEALMLADQPIIPLYFYVSKHLVNARIRGWHDNVMNVVYSKSLAKEGIPGGP